MHLLLIYKWKAKSEIFFYIWLYFRNHIRRQKQRQVSSSSVTRVVTNWVSIIEISLTHKIGLYLYPSSCLLYFTLLTTSKCDKYAYFKRF